MFKRIVLLVCLVVSHFSTAIEVSSMFEVMEEGETQFTIKNTGSNRIYLNVGVYQLETKNGELIKTQYNRHNIDEWEVTIRPAKTIIDTGVIKNISVNYECKKACDSNKDKMFQLALVPTPYTPEGSNSKQAVQVAIGFAPIVVVPKNEQAPEFLIQHHGDTLTFINTGDHFYKAVMKSCSDKQKCHREIKILAGRTLTYQLAPDMKKKTIKLILSSASDAFEKEFDLFVGTQAQ